MHRKTGYAPIHPILREVLRDSAAHFFHRRVSDSFYSMPGSVSGLDRSGPDADPPAEPAGVPVHHPGIAPRDFIQLLNSLQATARNKKLTKAEVLNGLRDYSQNYFFPEIKDEMVGYFPVDIFDDFLHRLSSFRSREISTEKLFATCDESINRAIMEKLLNQMFECSAIGNKSFFKGEERLYFRYRNRNYTYSLVDTIVLHNGLWKTIGLI